MIEAVRLSQQSGLKLVAILLTGGVLLQILCPAGLLAISMPAPAAASHAGCHGSAPKAPAAPLPHQSCCTGSPAPRPSSSIGSFAPARIVTARVLSAKDFQPNSFQPVPSGLPSLASPPGICVLRI